MRLNDASELFSNSRSVMTTYGGAWIIHNPWIDASLHWYALGYKLFIKKLFKDFSSCIQWCLKLGSCHNWKCFVQQLSLKRSSDIGFTIICQNDHQSKDDLFHLQFCYFKMKKNNKFDFVNGDEVSQGQMLLLKDQFGRKKEIENERDMVDWQLC